MGGLFSFRGGDPRMKRAEEERKRAAKARAQQAMQRLPRVLLTRGWNGCATHARLESSDSS